MSRSLGQPAKSPWQNTNKIKPGMSREFTLMIVFTSLISGNFPASLVNTFLYPNVL